MQSAVTAKPDHRHYAIALGNVVDVRAERVDNAGNLVADDRWQLRRVRVEPHARHDVGKVDPSRVDATLTSPALGSGPLFLGPRELPVRRFLESKSVSSGGEHTRVAPALSD